jgi:hypothetical protein
MFMRMRRILGLPVFICLLVLASLLHSAVADCQVNGVIGANGTSVDDTIVCDNNPAAPINLHVAGGTGGNDTITIDSNNQLGITGDGTVSGMGLLSAPVAGSDTITINGITAATVYGDFLNTNVNGASDTITINGRVAEIQGDVTTGSVIQGADTIIVNGTVTTRVSGDVHAFPSAGDIVIGGNDSITINGTVGAGGVIGDNFGAAGTRIGGGDTITINGTATVNGGITGETNATVGGNDRVTVAVGATITGTISGGNVAGDFDILTLTGSTADAAGYTQVLAFTGCNPCSGTVTIDGKTYTFTNFEQLVNLLTFTGTLPTTPATIVITFDPPKPPINDMTLICSSSNVMVYRLKTGEIEFYYINAPQYFLVAQVTNGALNNGQRIFAATSHTNPGWRVEISDGYFGQVFDSNNNPVGTSCPFNF